MKQNFAISVIAAAALASCAQNEDFTSQYNEKAKTMKFDVAYVGKNTRVTGDMTTQDLEKKNFILWGAAYKINSTTSEGGTTTETVETSGIWITDQEPLYFKKGTNYWEGFKEEGCSTSAEVTYPGSNYKTFFTAIAPSDEFASSSTDDKVNYTMAGQKNGETAPSSDSRKLTLENISVVQEIDNTSNPKKGTDYLIACQNSTSEEISLKFNHLLSKLRFAVWTDENTANGNDATTKIELNSLKIYLPKDKTAKYVQDAHNDVAGTWTWNAYTAPTGNPVDLSSYQDYILYDESTITPSKAKEIKYFSGPTTAHATENWNDVKLNPTFFIAPTESTISSSSATSVKLYIDIEYTVKRKVGSDWSTTNEESKKDETGQVYSAGHKVVKRTKMLVPISDGTHPDDSSNNEGLSHFHQGYIETLYICLRADQKVTFSTFTVADWVDDPINGDDLF